MGRMSSMTRKGQVTIPKEVRDALGLKPFDKVEIYLDNNGEAKLRRVLSLEEVAGSLPPLGRPIDEAITLAKEERARRLVAKMG
jgi:AbrB family looped-hinge helix DNA binding protein